MDHQMRRADKQIDRETCLDILQNGEYGILSTCGRDGYPYGVPVNYACADDKIFFHCAKNTGHKQENLGFSDKVSFTVVGRTEVVPEKFSDRFESVILFGTAKKLSDGEEKRTALLKLIEKYSPDFIDKGRRYIDASADQTDVYEITIETMTGKSARK